MPLFRNIDFIKRHYLTCNHLDEIPKYYIVNRLALIYEHPKWINKKAIN